MSTHVVGFRPADEKWNRMKSIWENCEAAKVEIPNEVLNFFGHDAPRDKPGVEIELDSHRCCKSWSDDMRNGYEIDVSKLPKDLKIIRFYNSW
jgi:hypothetical protein